MLKFLWFKCWQSSYSADLFFISKIGLRENRLFLYIIQLSYRKLTIWVTYCFLPLIMCALYHFSHFFCFCFMFHLCNQILWIFCFELIKIYEITIWGYCTRILIKYICIYSILFALNICIYSSNCVSSCFQESYKNNSFFYGVRIFGNTTYRVVLTVIL